MSNEYNVKLLVKQTKLNAKDALSHNKKYSGFKDLLKDNIPESLVDYNGNAYDISSVFHDTNWSSTDNNKTPSTNSSQSNQKFSQIETNSNLELYKNAKLVPHEDASGTTHKLWTVYDDASNNLLEHMINYKFDNSGSYLPMLTYYNGSSYVESTMFSDPLWWLIDNENHAISFFNTDSVLNGGTVNISASSTNPPKLTFYRYIGKTKVNNKLSVEGDISCNNIIISGTATVPTQTSGDNSTKIATTAFVQTAVAGIVDSAPETLNTLNELANALGDISGTIINRLTQVDTSCNDLSGVVTTNIGNISTNTSSFNDRKTIVDSSFNDLSNNISELDISYVDLSGVVTTNIGNISTNTSNINNKAPKNSPTFTGTMTCNGNINATSDTITGGTLVSNGNIQAKGNQIYGNFGNTTGISFAETGNTLKGITTFKGNINNSSGNQIMSFGTGVGATTTFFGDIQVNGNDIKDSVGATRLTIGSTNTITGNLTSTGDITVSGNVGIGTSDPSANLDIANTMPKIFLTNNKIGTSSFKFLNNEILGTIALYSKDQNDSSDVGETASINFVSTDEGSAPYPGISFKVHRNINTDSVIEAMRIDHTGNVGIGTTSPGIHSPSDPPTFPTKLDISGGGLRTTTNGSGLKIEGYHIGRSDYNSDWTNGAMYIQHYSSGDLLLCSGSSSGNVGIGTTSPVNKLSFTTDDYIGWQDAGTTTTVGKLYVYNNTATSTRDLWIQPQNELVIDSTASHGAVRVKTQSSVPFMISGQSSYVATAIGHNMKYNKVNGSNKLLEDISMPSSNPNYNSTYGGYAYYGGCAIVMGYWGPDHGHSRETIAMGFVFGDGKQNSSGYDPNTNANCRFIVRGNGNVGVGIITPKFPLHVESGDNTNTFSSAQYTRQSYNDSNSPVTTGTWAYDTSIYAKTGIVTSTYLVSHNGAITSSDERIKCEIENVPDDLALNQVLALETKYYHYKDPKRRETEKTIGFIAQEVESIIPGTVVKRQQFIPNILKAGEAIWTPKETDTSGNTIMWNLQVTNLQDISANTEVKFYFANGDISNNTDITEYEKDLTTIDASNNFEIDTKYEHVFVFGVKVNDFRTIKKEKIFALHHSAIQQIHKNAEAEKAKLTAAETEITTLKSTVETQQTTINTLQTTLTALEARIAALENP